MKEEVQDRKKMENKIEQQNYQSQVSLTTLFRSRMLNYDIRE